MQEVQLYIDGQKIDLFKDETISLTLNFGESKFPVLEVYSRDKI